MKPETKFYAQVKRNFTEIQWTRLENLSVPGTPDLLGYNNNCHFFTVELKVTKTNKVTFSPHQIAFHVKHPLNTFILVLDACLKVPKLYEGSCIRELVANGLKLEPRTQGWINSEEFFQSLALDACRFVITCHVSWYMLQACCLALDACCLMLGS
jgi:hypothetical protein